MLVLRASSGDTKGIGRRCWIHIFRELGTFMSGCKAAHGTFLRTASRFADQTTLWTGFNGCLGWSPVLAPTDLRSTTLFRRGEAPGHADSQGPCCHYSLSGFAGCLQPALVPAPFLVLCISPPCQVWY